MLRLTSFVVQVGCLVAICLGCSSVPSGVASSSSVTMPMVDESSATASPTPIFYAPMDTCRELSATNERDLCKQIVLDLDIDEPAFLREFEYGKRHIDLDGDTIAEVVIWVDSIGGTSGFPLLIYQTHDRGYRLLYNGLAWSPIIATQGVLNGWKRIVFLRQGGGVQAHFIRLEYSQKKKYIEVKATVDVPQGEILFSKNWSDSFYGPIQN